MQRIIAFGDIHGCFNTLKELIDKVMPTKDDLLIFLGDYIDRGPFIKETIDLLLTLEQQAYSTCFLMGNHEKMLLESMHYPRLFNNWTFNGAHSTLESFGIRKIQELPQIYANFFKSLKLYHQEDNLLFVHAGFTDSTNAFEDENTLLWTRNETYHSDFFVGKTIIHGHTPIIPEILDERLQNKSSVLNIDTGCVYPNRKNMGYLTALEFPALRLYQCKNIDLSEF